MSRHLPVQTVLVGASVACLIGVLLWFRWGQAADAQQEQRARLERQEADIQRVIDWHQRQGGSGEERVAAADLIAVIQELLTDQGLPPAACAGVTPRSAGGAGSQQAQEIRLTGLGPAEVGRWCSAWAARHTGWRVTEIAWKTGITPPAPAPDRPGLDRQPSSIRILVVAPSPD